jgi:hypothetical protein
MIDAVPYTRHDGLTLMQMLTMASQNDGAGKTLSQPI